MIGRASLRSRVVLTGITVVVVTLVAVNAGVAVAVRQELRGDVDRRLEERVALASELGRGRTAESVLDRLEHAGIPARLVRPDGEDLSTTALEMRAGEPLIEQEMGLAGGAVLVIAASTAEADRNLEELVLVQVLGIAFGACLAALLLIRVSRRALRPLDRVVETAHAIARGRTGERLRPTSTSSEIGRLAAAFDAMLDAEESALEQARASSELNHQFLADAAHQLRTPIAGIRTSAELLSLEPPADERRRLARNVVLASERAGLLVDGLLRMARMDQGVEPEAAPVDLVTLLRTEVGRFQLLSDDLEITLDTDVPSRVVDLDAASISEAVANLLDNACRHAVRRVDVTLGASGDEAVIAVSDDGPGLDAEAAERAFERFATLGGGDGAGLGLPIARGVVEAHGGRLVHERGAFVIHLPLRP